MNIAVNSQADVYKSAVRKTEKNPNQTKPGQLKHIPAEIHFSLSHTVAA